MRLFRFWFVILGSWSASAATPVLQLQNYFSNGQADTAGAVATDSQGNVYVAGTTNSTEFPLGGASRREAAAPLAAVSSEGTATGLPVGTERSVGSIAGDASGRVLYAATPDGVFVSQDAGMTWLQAHALPGGSQLVTTVSVMYVDPVDSSRVYLATNNGIFATSDAGGSWFSLNEGLGASGSGAIQVTSIAVSGRDHTHLFATTVNPSYLYRSTDAGGEWLRLNPVYAGEMLSSYSFGSVVFAIDPATDDVYAINSDGVLLKSMDGGETWKRLSVGLFGARMLVLDPIDGRTLYVVDNLGLMRSSDGGFTFTSTSVGSAESQQITGLALDARGALYVSTHNAVYVSRDGGVTRIAIPQAGNSSVRALAYVGTRLLIGRDSPTSVYLVKFDPTGKNILFTTFFGGSTLDIPTAVGVDGSGAAVVAGFTYSADFPVTAGVVQSVAPTDVRELRTGFLTKISPDGSRLIYSTLLGPGGTQINALAVDSAGNAYVTGLSSKFFPTTPGVLQVSVPPGDCIRPPSNFFLSYVNSGVHAFAARVSGDGSALSFSTFVTGTCGSAGNAIGLDGAQNVMVGGTTTSPDFPVLGGSYQDTFPGPTDKTLFPNALTAGFLVKLSPGGDKLLAGTYLGGGFETGVNAIAFDRGGNVGAAGETWGLARGVGTGAYQTQIVVKCLPALGFGPTPPPSNGYDGFVIKLDSELQRAVGATYLGGGCSDSVSALQFDQAGNAWVAGGTQSTDFPLAAPFGGLASGATFVSELNSNFSQLLFSSYIEDSRALRIATDGSVFVPGRGLSGGAYLAKIDTTQTLQVIVDRVSGLVTPDLGPPAALLGGVAPGELIRITGRNLGPADTAAGQLGGDGRLLTKLGGTQVFLNGAAMPLASVQAESISCFVPFAVVPRTIAEVQVQVDGALSNRVRVGVVAVAPEILAVVNEDGSTNSAVNPARPGSVITFYVSGLGQTNPAGVDGAVNVTPLPVPVGPVAIRVNGQSIEPSFVAGAPGLAAGVTQLNVPLGSGYAQSGVSVYLSNSNVGVVVYVGG